MGILTSLMSIAKRKGTKKKHNTEKEQKKGRRKWNINTELFNSIKY